MKRTHNSVEHHLNKAFLTLTGASGIATTLYFCEDFDYKINIFIKIVSFVTEQLKFIFS